MACPICLTNVNRKDVKLQCGHYIHRICLDELIKNNHDNNLHLMILKNEKPFNKDGQLSMFIDFKNSFITCPLCRKEYSIINETSFKDHTPMEILGRVWFADLNGNPSWCHHIVCKMQITDYFNIKDNIRTRIEKYDEISKSGDVIAATFNEYLFTKKEDLFMVHCPCPCGKIMPLPKSLLLTYDYKYASPKEFYDFCLNANFFD